MTHPDNKTVVPGDPEQYAELETHGYPSKSKDGDRTPPADPRKVREQSTQPPDVEDEEADRERPAY